MRQAMIDDVAVLSGEELVRAFGPRVRQQLADLAVAALRRGDESEVMAIDRRLREVEASLDALKPAPEA